MLEEPIIVSQDEELVAQGDILFVRLTEHDPATGAFKADKIIGTISGAVAPEDGRLIVGHSETGHHHYCPDVEIAALFGTSVPFVSVLKAKGEVTIRHDRGHDTHRGFVLPAGDYAVIKQRERRPDAWIAARD